MSFDSGIFLSLAFLFGIAAHFRAAGGDSFLRAAVSYLERRLGLLYAVVAVTVLFSPFILNDVLILILTPVLVGYCKESRANIATLLVAEVTFTNIASSVTPFGNPQNILLWQDSGISASQFVAGTWLPLTVAGGLGMVLLLIFNRRRVEAKETGPVSSWRPVAYLTMVAGVVFISNFLGVPGTVALGFGFAIGFAFTFRYLRGLVEGFDLRSLLILYVLVGLVYLIAVVIEPAIRPYITPVAAGSEPYSAEFLGVVSSFISNVPATQLVLSGASVTPHAAPTLAVDAGLAGNLDPIASFANLLALLIVMRSGLSIRRAVGLQVAIGLAVFLPALL